LPPPARCPGRPTSAPQATASAGGGGGGGGRQQPLQPLLDQLDAAKRRAAALQSRAAGLAAQLRQAREAASQQQVQAQQEREQLHRQLAKEGCAAAAAAKKLAAAQQQLQAMEQKEAGREQYVLQLERKLVHLHKEQQQLRQRRRRRAAGEQGQQGPCTPLSQPAEAAGVCSSAEAQQQQQWGWQHELSFSCQSGHAGAEYAGSVDAEFGAADAAADAAAAGGGEEELSMPALAPRVFLGQGSSGQAGGGGSGSEGAQVEEGWDMGGACDGPQHSCSVYAAAEEAWERQHRLQQAGGGLLGAIGGDAVGLLARQVEALQGGLQSFEAQLAGALHLG
jgi:hypothetical protein